MAVGHAPPALFGRRAATAVDVRCEEFWSVVTARGPLDIAVRDRLTDCLMIGLRHQQHLFVDLRAVTFLDCSTVGVLVGIRGAAERARKSVTLVTGEGCVPRLLEIFDVGLAIIEIRGFDEAR